MVLKTSTECQNMGEFLAQHKSDLEHNPEHSNCRIVVNRVEIYARVFSRASSVHTIPLQ
jgi:hypothetical protein